MSFPAARSGCSALMEASVFCAFYLESLRRDHVVHQILQPEAAVPLFKDYAHGDNVCNLKKQLFGALVIFANCFHSTISKHLVSTVTGM